MPADPDSLFAVADQVLAHADPAEAVEVYVTRGSSTSVRAYGGEVESLTSATSQGVGVRVVRDQRQGFAHAGTFDPDALTEAVRDARDNATFGAPDEHLGLPDPDPVEPARLDTWSAALEQMDTARKVELALELERRVVDADPRITGVRSAGYSDSVGEVVIASTTGIRAHTAATFCSIGASALARDGDDVTIGYAGDGARRPDDLDVDRVVDEAAGRAVGLLGGRQPRTGRVAVILEPRLGASVLGIVGGMLTGERLLKGRTPFADRIGERIASPLLDLVDDPSDVRSLGADSVDAEGLPSRRNQLISGGVLDRFLHNTYTGRRSGAGTSGSAVRGYSSTPGVGTRALRMRPDRGSLDELLADVELGLLVTSMTGLHSGVNPVSGDFSVGAEGIMIRGGVRAEPVREATIASTLPRILLDIVAVGGEIEWLPGGSGIAPMVIDGIALSGS